MNICFFCSASFSIDPDFFALTKDIGQWMAQAGHTVVFGGVNMGLMECLAKAAHTAGGRTVGIVPNIIERAGRLSDYVDVDIPCETLNDRKQLMEDNSDAFVVLPGGIGTLDELFTVASAATLEYHKKPLILFNMKGFWDSLVAMLDDLHARGVTRKQWRSYITVVSTLEELKGVLNGHA